ncbi:MAG: formyltetrahydrofolate deformylase [Opitutaceae bacterium]|nr:formyltetrahydrofolate deformylase [Opitutaceae bacterium]
MINKAPTIVALLSGRDIPGLVSRVSSHISERGGNIIHADQHHDQEAGIFFQRIEWIPQNVDIAAEEEAFRQFASEIGMSAKVANSAKRVKMVIMVSKMDHCFHDLILRWKAEEFNCDIVGVISNHGDLQETSASYGIPYHVIPVTRETKEAAEKKQLELLRELKADIVVLARYMQVLSGPFLKAIEIPVINIHHSFLPAFAGGRPYHQAYSRGVKLTGATAHYATEVLDDGPIINQDVIRISHRHNVKDLIRKGRHLEKTVLGQAVSWHLDNRILVYGNKTVVFD